MNFISIRKKLIRQVSRILIGSFIVVLSIVAGNIFLTAKENLAKSETYIRSSLEAKASILVSNNSKALTGMAEDYAFSAVKELVSSTVSADKDIVYGIYMDAEQVPWVNASRENPEGNVTPGEALEDNLSKWASGLAALEFRKTDIEGDEVLEFAAPVVVDEETLGIIRYGLSTSSMRQALAEEIEAAKRSALIALSALLGINALAIIFGFILTRKMADRITSPLESLTASAGKISKGDYTTEIKVSSNDEIGTLAENFDSMRTKIQKKIHDLSLLNTCGEDLALVEKREDAYKTVIKMLNRQFDTENCWVFDAESNSMLIKTGGAKDIEENIVKELVAQASQKMTPFTITGLAAGNEHLSGGLVLPLIDEDSVKEIIVASLKNSDRETDSSEIEFCQSLSRMLFITISNIALGDVIREHARTLEHKVEERTAELRAKTNDIQSMMEHMHQGLFTIMENGLIHNEYASYCEKIFETKEIAGTPAMSLLFSKSDVGTNSLDQIKTAVDSIIGEDELMWEFNSHLLISEFKINLDDTTKILHLDWDPIILDGEIEKIMVTVRDVTKLKELESEAIEQKKELEIIGQILAVGSKEFDSFIQSSMEFVNSCEKVISETDDKDIEVLSVLFRNMHTVKGNARTYGFSHITDSVHNVESTYDNLRKDEDAKWDKATLLEELEVAKDDIKRYSDVARDKLNREVSEGEQTSIQTDSQRLDEILNSYQNLSTDKLPDPIKSHLRNTYDVLIEGQGMELSHIIEGIGGSIASIASELNKPSPSIQLDASNIVIKGKNQEIVRNVFTHILRNSLDHGIELPEEREKSGKTAQGKINVDAKVVQGKLVVVISDDGRGIALHKLKEKAIKNNALPNPDNASPESVANLVFSSGVSTAEKVSHLSGRGVGMDAVKKFITDIGGDVNITLDKAVKDCEGFAGFSIVLSFPPDFFIQKPSYLFEESA